MKEIWIQPDNHLIASDVIQHLFVGEQPVAKMMECYLYKVIQNDKVYYHLTNNSNIIAWLYLTKLNDTFYSVDQSRIIYPFTGRGFQTFMFDYAILDDQYYIIMNVNEKPYLKSLWKYFCSIGHFPVKNFDLEKLEIFERNHDLFDDEKLIFKENKYAYIGTPTGKTINETLKELNLKYKDARFITWYNYSSENFFNY